MQLLSRLLSSSHRRPRAKVLKQWRPALESLEERTVLSTSIVSNFNGTAIPVGDTIWFSSVFKPSGVGTAPVTLHVTNQCISFKASGTDCQVFAPDSTITLSSSTTTATTTYDGATNAWIISLPAKFSGNGFAGGVGFQLTTALPGGINPVTWQATFTSDTAGVSLNWQWAAAVYKPGFDTDPGSLGVKPLDQNTGTLYNNSDHAGTPENFKSLVTGGARGGGGSNWTGSLSPTVTVKPGVVVSVPPASISGFAYDLTGPEAEPIMFEVITLTGTDYLNNSVTLTAVTDASGSYNFSVQPGTYTLSGDDTLTNQAVAGSEGGTALGDQITGVTVQSGDSAVNYDFLKLAL
jgi:hypothetical protein